MQLLGKEKNKELLNKINCLDLEEERMNNKFNRIAKAGAIRLEGIRTGQGVADVIQGRGDLKEKKKDYRFIHYNIAPI